MLRSLKVLGVVALTILVPSLALANGGIPSGGGNGPSFETSVTIDTGPLNQKCPAIVTIHATTTLLNPDGNSAHAHATARFAIGNTQTASQQLNFAAKTTQTWTATYNDPDLGAIGESSIIAQITDWSGTTTTEAAANWGTFQYGCGRATAGPPPSIPGVAPAIGICRDYTESQLSVIGSGSNIEVKWTGAKTANGTTPSSQSMYLADKKADADQAFDVIKHFTNMCVIQDSSLVYFEGAGARNTPNWGTCVAYDGKNVTIVNDATGWLVKSGAFLIARVPVQADALTLAEAAKRRSNDCHIGEGTESAARVLHYLR
jgi:hypothetical protein